MPKGKRGGKGKPHALKLSLRVLQAPAGITKAQIKRALVASIDSGVYALPSGWVVQLGWQNANHLAMRFDEWTNAMTDSTQGGRGWDAIVRRYVERMR